MNELTPRQLVGGGYKLVTTATLWILALHLSNVSFALVLHLSGLGKNIEVELHNPIVCCCHRFTLCHGCSSSHHARGENRRFRLVSSASFRASFINAAGLQESQQVSEGGER